MKLALSLAAVLLAFSGNSLLTRAALDAELISPPLFSAVRLFSGGFILALLVLAQRRAPWPRVADAAGSLALFGYVAAFSFAYVVLDAGFGALVLFGMVQVTTAGWSALRGEKASVWSRLGLVIALIGLIALVRPGSDHGAFGPTALMAIAGISWGVYTLLGRGAGDPTQRTARNFIGASALALILLLALPVGEMTARGAVLASLSGAVTSGLGYTLWYKVLPQLSALTAGAMQLLVPPATLALGALLLAETVTLSLLISGAIILGGVALTFIPPNEEAPRSDERGA
ncbi:MAG: DMT family transporter [Pseudomonadota bacterium]